MSELKTAALGLGDANIDPEILTKEIDHDFFDDPLGGAGVEEEVEATCQVDGERKTNFLNKMPNMEEGQDASRNETSEPKFSSISNEPQMRLEKKEEDELLEAARTVRRGISQEDADSGRSSSNVTVHLELGRDGKEQCGVAGGDGSTQGTSAEDFYSIQSNANYPRPKESYQLQQRRRSFGTIQQPQRSSGNTGKEEMQQPQLFQPMNITDCGLNGHFGDLSTSDSSNSSPSGRARDGGGEEEDVSDSDLSDSSESELESLDTDDEEFVDMLEKYFEYIDPDTDCSDLTEVSPLSSLAASPLPPSFFPGLEMNGDSGDLLHHPVSGHQTMNITSDDQLCLATGALQIGAYDETEEEEDDEYDQDESGDTTGLSSSVEIDVAAATVTAVAGAVPAVAQLLERDRSRGGKPKLPMVISTTETVIIPAEESDDDNNALNIVGEDTYGTSIDINDVDAICYNDPPEEASGECGERDPRAHENKELDVCFNCCVMEHAKKILSREASPSRKHASWLAKQQMEEGNGNSGGNGNNGDEIERNLSVGGTSSESRSRGTWNGKTRASSSTSATSSSSSTATTGSSSAFGSGASGSASCSGGGQRKSQRNFTFTPEQMRKIERENHILLRKILDTHQKGYHHGHHGNHCHHHRCRNHGGHGHGHHHHQSRTASSSTSISRLRQQKRIEHENAILMKKLQTVKPSKEIVDAFGKPVKN